MSIKSFIRKVCRQKAVYWEYDGPADGGGAVFKDPEEIKVRWDESTEIVSDRQGKEFMSNAQLLTPGDLKEQSYVWLGELAELPSQHPQEIENAFEIKKMDRHPLFRSKTLDVFIAYL